MIDMMVTTIIDQESQSIHHIGMNKSAKAEPNVPGALGASPEPNPTPQKTIKRSYQDISWK